MKPEITLSLLGILITITCVAYSFGLAGGIH